MEKSEFDNDTAADFFFETTEITIDLVIECMFSWLILRNSINGGRKSEVGSRKKTENIFGERSTVHRDLRLYVSVLCEDRR